MIKIIYAPAFVRQFRKLSPDLQEEVLEKIELFKELKNHKQLKVHKLHGAFSDCYGFSINYRYRVIFSYNSKNSCNFLRKNLSNNTKILRFWWI